MISVNYVASRAPLPDGWEASITFNEVSHVFVLRVTDRDEAGRPFSGERNFDPIVMSRGQERVVLDGARAMIPFIAAAIKKNGATTVYCSYENAGSACVACGRSAPGRMITRCAFVDPNTGEIVKWIDDHPAVEYMKLPKCDSKIWKTEYVPQTSSVELGDYYAKLLGGA